MDKKESNTDKNTWRNTDRISVGRRKGQFKKRNVSVKKKKSDVDTAKNVQVSSNNEPVADILVGSELHEPSVLAKEMWCSDCQIPLSFRFAQNKKQQGLAFIYDIKCCKCSKITSVRTGATFRQGNSVMFEVNAKAAHGIMQAGIGEKQFNLLLSTMNVKTISISLLKRYEDIVGPHIEALAQESSRNKFLEEEVALIK